MSVREEARTYREYWLCYYDEGEDQIRLAGSETQLADAGFRHATAEQRLARDEARLRASLPPDAWITVIEDERTAVEVERQRPGRVPDLLQEVEARLFAERGIRPDDARRLSWSRLTDPAAPWLHFVAAPEADLDYFADLCPPGSRDFCRILRGRRSLTDDALFDEWAAALQFPAYFGRNWAPLTDCMRDQMVLPVDRYTLLLTEGDRILADDERGFGFLLDILAECAETAAIPRDADGWPAGPTLMRAVLHADPPRCAIVEARLAAARLPYQSWRGVHWLTPKPRWMDPRLP